MSRPRNQGKYRKDVVPQLDRDTRLYLAGLCDGEASFIISTTLYRGKATYNASVRIAMTHEGIIKWIGEQLDRPVRIHALGKNATPRARTVYRVVLQNSAAIVSFVEQILPFLRVKREAAETLLAFCKSRATRARSYGDAKAYTSQEVAMHGKLRQLNRVGINDEGAEGKVCH